MCCDEPQTSGRAGRSSDFTLRCTVAVQRCRYESCNDHTLSIVVLFYVLYSTSYLITCMTSHAVLGKYLYLHLYLYLYLYLISITDPEPTSVSGILIDHGRRFFAFFRSSWALYRATPSPFRRGGVFGALRSLTLYYH